ncbi:hypothetical protein [Haladaptatus sp. DYF46]|uniref:hypothetical protein n=1 Tax=Haladaptatus sp. DYF46 TaxID=2886041 RepID=UPI001E5EA31C|nr:hypothetical protein [Haladaptatus sp. DYF46]
MAPAFFTLFMVAFVAIGALNVLKPRAMACHQMRVRYGAKGDVEFSDSRIMMQRVISLIILVVGVWWMLTSGFL